MRHRLFPWLKGGIFVVCCWFVVQQVREKDLMAPLHFLADSLQQAPAMTGLILLLLPLNWGLEAWKWQMLARAIEPTRYNDAVKAILSGLAMGMAAPQGAAELGGRLLHMRSHRRIASIGAWLCGNYSQMLVTGGMGLLAFLYSAKVLTLVPPLMWWYALLASLVLMGVFTLAWYRQRGAVALLARIKWLRPFLPAVDRVGFYDRPTLHLLLGISLVRYLTFSLQFALVFMLMLPGLPLAHLMAATALVLLAKSLIPAFNMLGDLGVREFSALLFFSWFAVPQESVVVASLVVWVINLLVPSLAGLVFIFSLKLSTR